MLEAYTLVAYRQKAQIEHAISQLLELLNLERDYLPALVCLSQAYLMLKQSPKARNHLKRVAKMQARVRAHPTPNRRVTLARSRPRDLPLRYLSPASRPQADPLI